MIYPFNSVMLAIDDVDGLALATTQTFQLDAIA
jgi:hypothetical protein